MSGFTQELLLLCFAGILDGVQSGTVVLQEIKAKIWELELLEILLVHVQQDASKIKGGWATVEKLVRILWSDLFLSII